MREVTDELNIAGIRTKRNGKISINSVTRMLHNRKYIGEYSYRDTVIPGGIPAIVPKELFDKVQERMAKTKKAPAHHKAEDEYLLTTKLFCGECKRMMTGESGTSHMGNVHRYYKCNGARKGGDCHKKTVKKEWIENMVLSKIREVIFDDELLNDVADRLMERLHAENTNLPILRRQLKEVEKGIENFMNAIQMGIITPSTKERLNDLETQKSELTVQIMKEEMSVPLLTKEQILFFLTKFRELNPKLLDHRRRLIDSFVNAVYLYDDRLTILFNCKDGNKTYTFAEIETAQKGSGLSALAAPNATQIEPQGLICVVFLCKKAEDQLRSVKKSVLLAESKKENGNMTAVFLFWVIFPLFRPFHWSSAQAPCGIRLLRRDRRG